MTTRPSAVVAWPSVAACVLLWAATACSSGHEGDAILVSGPAMDNFGKVVEVLDFSCGNLACHGTTARNLRLYGDQGRRLDEKDVPCGAPTTAAEVRADFRSIVGLEPEVMSDVVASHGAHPERLTLVRKARGTESHKGGSVFQDSTDMTHCLDACAGGPVCTAACYGDRCLVSWIASSVDVPACDNSLPITRCNPAL